MFQLQIITLLGVFMDKEVHEVRVPTIAGPIAVNKDHTALVGAIKPGILSVQFKKGDKDSEIDKIAVYDGTVEVLNNVVTILVDDVDTPGEYSVDEAEKALKRAQDMAKNAKDSVALAEAHSMIDRSAIRLQLANLKRHRK